MGVENIIGDVIGAGVNLYNSYAQREEERKQREAKQRAIREAQSQANMTYDQLMDMLGSYDTSRIRLASPEMASEYMDLISNYQPQTYEFGKFGDEYNKTVEDFLNPEAEKIANLAGLETQAQLAGQGAAKGTGGVAGIGYSRWKAAEELYKDAQNQMLADRSQAYREYSDYIANMQNKLNTISQGQLQKANLLGGALTNEQQQQADYMSDLIGLMENKAGTNINATIGAFS